MSSSISRKDQERTKLIQEKCQTLLTQMLRDEDNKYCVDCDAKGKKLLGNMTISKKKIIFSHTLLPLSPRDKGWDLNIVPKKIDDNKWRAAKIIDQLTDYLDKIHTSTVESFIKLFCIVFIVNFSSSTCSSGVW